MRTSRPTILGIPLTLILGVLASPTQAQPQLSVPGAPLTADRTFTAAIDENGAGSIRFGNAGPFTPLPGSLLPDPSAFGSGRPVLTYLLPPQAAPVGSGDVVVNEPGMMPTSDVLRFTNANGQITPGGPADRMILYSDTVTSPAPPFTVEPLPEGRDLADTGIPVVGRPFAFTIEMGVEGGRNGTTWVAPLGGLGMGGPANTYLVTSDVAVVAVPEPSSLWLAGIAALVLLWAIRSGAVSRPEPRTTT